MSVVTGPGFPLGMGVVIIGSRRFASMTYVSGPRVGQLLAFHAVEDVEQRLDETTSTPWNKVG